MAEADGRFLPNDLRRRASQKYRRKQGVTSGPRSIGMRLEVRADTVSQDLSRADARVVRKSVA
jgi:hypothetical protein